MQLRVQLVTFKKNDQTMVEYFAKMKSFANTLGSIGQKLIDEEIISYMLAGLRQDYDALVTSICTIIDPMTLYRSLCSYFELRYEEGDQQCRASDRRCFCEQRSAEQ